MVCVILVINLPAGDWSQLQGRCYSSLSVNYSSIRRRAKRWRWLRRSRERRRKRSGEEKKNKEEDEKEE